MGTPSIAPGDAQNAVASASPAYEGSVDASGKPIPLTSDLPAGSDDGAQHVEIVGHRESGLQISPSGSTEAAGDDRNEFDKQSDTFDSAQLSARVIVSILGKTLTPFQASYLDNSLQAVAQMGIAPDAAMIRKIAVRAADLPGLGVVSTKFETGGRGPGVISTGAGGDKGGVSYGSYQMASNFGIPQDFLKHEGAQWANEFTTMDATSSTGSFAQTWRSIAAATPDAFAQAQHDYIAREMYAPVLAMADILGFSTSDVGVQNALWSQSVQSSLKGNMNIFEKFLTVDGGNPLMMSPQEQIAGLYTARGDYTTSIHISPASAGVPRYNVEMPIAVNLSKTFPVGP